MPETQEMSEQQAGVGPHLPPQAINVGSGQTVRLQQVLTTAGSQNVNVISTRGQQFVITSQVPGLTQVGTHNILFTFRIVNIYGLFK